MKRASRVRPERSSYFQRFSLFDASLHEGVPSLAYRQSGRRVAERRVKLDRNCSARSHDPNRPFATHNRYAAYPEPPSKSHPGHTDSRQLPGRGLRKRSL